MPLDPVTLHVANGLMNVTYGVMFVALWHTGRRQRHFLAWGVAHLLIAAGVLGFAFVGRTSLIASALMIALISMGIAAIWLGCRLFDNRSSSFAILPLGLLAPLGFVLGAIGLGDPRIGQVLTVASLGILSTGIALQVLNGEATRSFPRVAAALANLGFLPAYLLSALATLGILALQNDGTVVLVADQVLTNVLAVALLAMAGERRQRRLADLALVDPLTGALNRAGLEAFETTTARSPDRAVLLVDLDHFKAINDRHGHPAGDEVLRRFVSIARETIRPGDAVARLGGEEFVILLSSSDRESAIGHAEMLRALVEHRPVDWNGVSIAPTVSIGVASVAGGEALASAIERADHALYLAKKSGRNRIAS